MFFVRNKMREFAADERGMVMIMVSIMLPVLIGFALLAIDMSRANNLHNDLQKGADAFALAAAAELDGASDSWTRAERALANMVDNTTRFSADGPSTLASSGSVVIDATNNACRSRGDISWCFLKSIPALDSTLLNANGSDALGVNHRAANTGETRFIQVQIDPAAAGVFSAIFPASFLTGDVDDNGFNISAQAVAGFGSAVCDFTPVYICNPYEGSATTLREAIANPEIRKRMIELRQQGGASAQNSPGNYGFLVPTIGGSGANAIRDMIAQVAPQSCYSQDGVEVRPGFIATARDALNVRFDVYNGPMNSVRTDPNYAPATNVRKGYRTTGGNACNASEVEEPNVYFQKFPRDNCFASSTCPYANGRVGDGNWDFDTYWNENRFNLTGEAKPLGADGVNVASSSNAPSRYAMYRYEIEHDMVSQTSQGSAGGTGGESGTPACSSQTAPADIDRRLIYGAIINCQEHDIGNGASGDEVPPEAFASFFLTETVESGPDQIIRVELVDITGVFGAGTLEDFQRDEAQLYR